MFTLLFLLIVAAIILLAYVLSPVIAVALWVMAIYGIYRLIKYAFFNKRED